MTKRHSLTQALLVGAPNVVGLDRYPRIELSDAATELLRKRPDVVVLDARPVTRELLGVVRRLRQLKPETTTLILCVDLVPRSVVDACYDAGVDFVVSGRLDLPRLLDDPSTQIQRIEPGVEADPQTAAQGQTLEALGQLAAGLAHELNNQLTAILGFNELLTLRLAPADEKLHSYAKRIGGAAEESRALVGQLLAFGRRQVMQPEQIEPERLLETVGQRLAQGVAEGAEVIVDCPEGLWRIRADHAQLETVLLCLGESALRALPAEGGRVTISAENTLLGPDQSNSDLGFLPGEYVKLVVHDTGESLDAEARQRIFEPFFIRSPNHPKTLGLAAAYGIVKQSGGWIWVKARELGTAFELFFPREEKKDTTRRLGPRPLSNNAPGQTRLLVIEDQDPVRTYAREVLEAAGYHVTEAACGEEGLELLEADSAQFDLILTDVAMPGMGGRSFADEALRLGEQRIVFMSGHPGTALVECGLLRDGERFVHKPFSASDLLNEVKESLAHDTSSWSLKNDQTEDERSQA